MTPLKILLVDDNDDDCFLARRALLKSGIPLEVETVNDGIAALDRLHGSSSPLDLVLLDIQMPKLSGIDVLTRLQQQPPASLPPIVVLSASNSDRDIAHCRELGAVDFLHKPLTTGDVAPLMNRLGLNRETAASCKG